MSPQKDNLVGDIDEAFTTMKHEPRLENYHEHTVVQAPRF